MWPRVAQWQPPRRRCRCRGGGPAIRSAAGRRPARLGERRRQGAQIALQPLGSAVGASSQPGSAPGRWRCSIRPAPSVCTSRLQPFLAKRRGTHRCRIGGQLEHACGGGRPPARSAPAPGPAPSPQATSRPGALRRGARRKAASRPGRCRWLERTTPDERQPQRLRNRAPPPAPGLGTAGPGGDAAGRRAQPAVSLRHRPAIAARASGQRAEFCPERNRGPCRFINGYKGKTKKC